MPQTLTPVAAPRQSAANIVATEKIIEWDEVAWRLDTEMLSPEARGIYRDILGHLYLQLDRSGVITGTREELARAGRCSALQMDLALKEIEKYRVSEVNERNGVVTLVNRRMNRRKKHREGCLLRVKNHRDGGVKRPCNAPRNAPVTPVVTHPPQTPLISSDKADDKALSSLSALKERGPGKTQPATHHDSCNAHVTPSVTLKKRLTEPQRALAARFEIVLGHQWPNDAGKWVNRIKSEFGKTERVLAEVESATKESRVRETPAQYAEQIWKEFK